MLPPDNRPIPPPFVQFPTRYARYFCSLLIVLSSSALRFVNRTVFRTALSYRRSRSSVISNGILKIISKIIFNFKYIYIYIKSKNTFSIESNGIFSRNKKFIDTSNILNYTHSSDVEKKTLLYFS